MGIVTIQKTVGHVPIEISRFINFAIVHGCNFKLSVVEPRPVRSPLVQGGLEIKATMTVDWDDHI